MFTGGIPQHSVATTDQSFASLGLSSELVETLKGISFHFPTPIQVQVIPKALEGRDIIGLAQTGSGKTGAFGLPLAEKLIHGRGVRGLILSPTREIALQTQAFLEVFGQDHHLDTVCLIGGVNIQPQIRDLKRNPDIVVATPGRLLDHMQRRTVRVDRIEHLVMDEADHMLDLGFLPQIQRILEAVPEERQTLMFSATMPPPIERMTQQFMRDPERIDILPPGRTADGLEHRLYLVGHDDRLPCLKVLVSEEEGSMLVFLRRKIDAEWAYRVLGGEGHAVDRIHSDRSQQQRVAALRGLREGKHRVLLATDVAARGIDIPVIQHVVNFDVPETAEDYIHRAGRTARGDANGIVSLISTWQGKPVIKQIESELGQPLPRWTAPGIEPWMERKTTIRGRKIVRRRLL
jgi:ATP-dependent RNA helicase RhlE